MEWERKLLVFSWSSGPWSFQDAVVRTALYGIYTRLLMLSLKYADQLNLGSFDDVYESRSKQPPPKKKKKKLNQN